MADGIHRPRRKEIEARLGEVEPAIAREVILDLLTDDISPVIALSRLLLALGGAEETEELLASVARALGARRSIPACGRWPSSSTTTGRGASGWRTCCASTPTR